MNPYNLIADFYDANIDPNLYQDMLTLIKSEVSSGQALDLATGTGKMAFLLAEQGFRVDASDVSITMLHHAEKHLAKHNLPVKLFVHDVLDPIEKVGYDCVSMASDVVNHLSSMEDVNQVFANVSEALKEEGVFVFDAIHQDYRDQMIGYQDELRLKGKSLKWTVLDHQENSFEHILELGKEKANLVQYIYRDDQLTEALLRHHMMVVKTVKTEERMIYLAKKVK